MQAHVVLFFSIVAVAVVQAVPPVMTLDQKVTTMKEGLKVNQQLMKATCTDPDGDKTRVYVSGVNPPRCPTCFEVLDCLPQECLQYRAGVGTISYASAQSYIITLTCEDDTGSSVTDVVQVDIIPNTAPYWTPAEKYRLIPPISGKTAANTKIVTAKVTAQDDDPQDILTYSLTVEPGTSSSNYRIDPSTGDIYTTVDMRSECRPDVTLFAYVSDGISTTGPLVISVPIKDPNVAPVALNLDTIATIPENTPELPTPNPAYVMNFQDGNSGDKVTYTYTTNNPAGAAQYTLDGKSPNIIATGLDYENVPLRDTDLVVTATDGFCTSPPYTLKLRVTDVNERPTLTPSPLSVQVCEGKGEFNPGYTLTDPDTPDTVRYSFTPTTVNNPSGFGINPDTGAIIVLIDYDVDVDKPSRTAPMPATQKFVVVATDKGGLTATATVTATFLDCNDNAPYFTTPAYEYSATECTTGGTKLGTVTATDKDSAREQNNELYYEGSGGSVVAGTNGEIIVVHPLSAGSVITFDVYAHDMGKTPGPLRSVNPTVVSVRFTPCPTTPPPTQAPPVVITTTTTTTTPKPTTTTTATTFTRTDDDPNLPWIIIAALLGTFMLGLLTYMLWRYCRLCVDACGKLNCKQSCRGRPARAAKVKERPEAFSPQVRREPMKKERPQSSTPSEAPKEKDPNGSGFIYSFWKEHYKEKTLTKGAPHNSKPEPGDMTDYYPHTYDPADPPLSEVTPAAEPSAGATKKTCAIQ